MAGRGHAADSARRLASRSRVVGCDLRNRPPPGSSSRAASFSKKLTMPLGSKPARDSTSMPMRSASYSFSRVKLIWRCTAAACVAVEIAEAVSVDTSVVAATRIEAIEAAIAAMLLRCWS